jgi:hypothetical protein
VPEATVSNCSKTVALFDHLVGMTTDRTHDLSILCLEPRIDNLPCLRNNCFFGTCGTFRQHR